MVELRMDPLAWLRKQLEGADVDLLREMVHSFAETLMSADADAICGAPYGKRSEEQVNRRNGYGDRDFDTRTGTIELRVPKLRQGSYYPEWLFERPRRAERALVAVICECYVRGVSTRRVDGLVKTLGMEGISKSQVSALAKALDTEVAAFRSRPLDNGPYPYLWLYAMAVKAREEGRVTSAATVVATAVSADGHREILGLDTFTAEDGAAWTRFLRDVWPEGYPGCVWLSPTTTRAWWGHRRRPSWMCLAPLPDALHAQRPLPRPPFGRAVRGHANKDHLRSAVCPSGAGPAKEGHRLTRGVLPGSGPAP